MSTNKSGVRNLRAMFENKTSDLITSTSPPSRGRSPADSEASLTSRPVSKVRASFIAVERPAEAGQGQQWGLRKASDVGIMAYTNKMQLDATAVSKTAQDQEPGGASERLSTEEQTNGVGGFVVADEADTTAQKPTEMDGGLGVILKGSAFESSPSETNNAGAATQNIPSKKSNPAAKATSTSQSVSLATRMKDARKDPPPKGNFIASKNAISVLPPGGRIRPQVSTTSHTTPKSPPQKTPNSPNTRKELSSPKSASTGEPGKEAAKPSLRSPTLPKPDRKSLLAGGPKATQTSRTKGSDVVPASNGVKKDTSPTSPKTKARPRSPTRPARLPAAATAPTAASTAKTSSVSDRPASRASTTAISSARNVPTSQHNKSTAKSPHSASAASLAKKPSRASLASRPGGTDLPKSRNSNVSKAPDEGFLARMTRPTASFAQKTHDKLQVHSPPREKKSGGKPKLRKSMGTLEDGKENVADTNGVEDHTAQEEAPESNGIVNGPAQPAETSAHTLAAGQEGEASTEEAC